MLSLLDEHKGLTIGAALRRIQVVIAVALNLALYLFFLAGGIGVLAFEPTWLQNIAAVIPLTYGRHALEQAIFYSASEQLAGCRGAGSVGVGGDCAGDVVDAQGHCQITSVSGNNSQTLQITFRFLYLLCLYSTIGWRQGYVSSAMGYDTRRILRYSRYQFLNHHK